MCLVDYEMIQSSSADYDGEDGDERDGRNLLYWQTLISTTTSFAYNATVTLGSLFCTPTSFSLSECGRR